MNIQKITSLHEYSFIQKLLSWVFWILTRHIGLMNIPEMPVWPIFSESFSWIRKCIQKPQSRPIWQLLKTLDNFWVFAPFDARRGAAWFFCFCFLFCFLRIQLQASLIFKISAKCTFVTYDKITEYSICY